MSAEQHMGSERTADGDAGGDVLTYLHRAEQAYVEEQARWAQQQQMIKYLHAELAQAGETKSRLEHDLATSTAAIEHARADAARQRERAGRLEAALIALHQDLFGANLFDLILRAAIALTEATRGLYISLRGEQLRVRAALDVDAYPAAAPSPFLQALCREVAAEQRPLLLNSDADWSQLPAPRDAGEQFRVLLAAPVVLRDRLSGIVLVADKREGDFDDQDASTLLSIGNHAAVLAENHRLEQEVQRAYRTTVAMLADAMEVKDAYTHGHCDLVAYYARLIAERLNLSAFDRAVVYHAATLHDVGKIAVSDGILNKPGALLPEERSLMRSHVRVGHDLITKIRGLDAVADVVLHHHEAYDGSGYPDGLAGDAIPLAARIVSVVDAYCAMITKRSYKDAYSEEHAREELRRCAGNQFDPTIVGVLLDILESPSALTAYDDDERESDAEYTLLLKASAG